MLATLINALSRMRRYTLVLKFVTLLLLSVGWVVVSTFARSGPAQPLCARQNAQDMYRRAVQICTALGSVCSIDPRPSYTERTVACYPGDHSPRRMWKFACEIDGRQVAIVFNDKTGGLCYLVADHTHRDKSPDRELASIENREEAAEIGFQRLKAMNIIPHGTLMALRGAPQLNNLNRVWDMTWNVKANPQSSPYWVHLVLDRYDHMPISVTDAANLNGVSR